MLTGDLKQVVMWTLAGVVVLASFAPGAAICAERVKPRVVVLTDISNEPDDEESMVRFLVYANEYDVEGLIATTSVWLRDKIRPERIRERIEAYGKVRGNLLKHDKGFPTAEYLMSVVKHGRAEFGMDGVGKGKSSEGSEHIISVVDRDDPRPVWVSVWGGANCLAQALWDVRERRSEKELAAFVSKLRVYTISDQDNSGRWMRLNFPGLCYIVSPSSVGHHEYYKATWTGIAGDRWYRNGPMHKFELVDNPWLEENIIKGHGPLGALYPKLEYIMEGDTPSFLNLIDNGMQSDVSPSYGGWGGRYVFYQSYGETQPIWTNVRGGRDLVVAEDGREYKSAQATIWRWREAFQHDFAARMDWCVKPYDQANHPPVAKLDHDNNLKVKGGDVVRLSATKCSDPDGDGLSYEWIYYQEAGSYDGDVDIRPANRGKAKFAAPKVKSPVKLHVILAVKDDGTPRLYRYQRVIVDVRP